MSLSLNQLVWPALVVLYVGMMLIKDLLMSLVLFFASFICSTTWILNCFN